MQPTWCGRTPRARRSSTTLRNGTSATCAGCPPLHGERFVMTRSAPGVSDQTDRSSQMSFEDVEQGGCARPGRSPPSQPASYGVHELGRAGEGTKGGVRPSCWEPLAAGVGEEDPEGGASAGAVLHRRAAAWYRQAGNLEEASYHATAAGSPPKPMR
jgi:hypothetical protein